MFQWLDSEASLKATLYVNVWYTDENRVQSERNKRVRLKPIFLESALAIDFATQSEKCSKMPFRSLVDDNSRIKITLLQGPALP